VNTDLDLSGAYDLRPRVADDATVRLAPEFTFGFENRHGTVFSLSAIYYFAWLTLSSYAEAPSSTPLGSHGPQVEAAVRFAERYQIALRYGSVLHSRALTEDAAARGEAMIADSSTDLDEAAIARYQNAGESSGEHEFSAAFSYYLIGSSLAWQSDASVLPVQSTDGLVTDLRIRTQVQLAF
jgi:hypothetical protein